MTKTAYFLNLCQAVALRSPNPGTKHGCVIVNGHGRVLSTGYNGVPYGAMDGLIPTDRAERLEIFEHAERNAIYGAARHGTPLDDSMFYVTGRPCVECVRAMMSVGARGVAFGGTGSSTSDRDAAATTRLMAMFAVIDGGRTRSRKGAPSLDPRDAFRIVDLSANLEGDPFDLMYP